MQRKIFLLLASLVVLLLVAACGAAATPETITVVETVIVKEEVEVIKEVEGETITVIETVEVIQEVEKEVVVTATPGPRSVETDWPDMSWDEVVAEADGQTINWYFWGGSANINNYVAEYLGGRLQDEYNITLNSVHINDTVEAVNLVLGEVDAGQTEDGSVDMIWINGENFKTLRQADLLFGPYAGGLPNNEAFVDTEGAYFELDFGYPVQGYESLYESAQMVIEYDSAVVSDPPRSIPDWVAWVCENPGLATYSAPPDFTGTAFLTSFFYHYTGGAEQWQGRWNEEKQALFDEKAPAVWDVLNEIEPCLWRAGETYASDPRQLDQLLGNGEIAFNMNYESTHAAQQVRDGLYPESIRNFVWDEGTVANASYVAIPVNSPHKAAALVLANLILDPEAQLEKADPEVWGAQAAIDMTKVSDDIRAAFDAIDRGEQTLPLSELSPSVPPLSAEMLPVFEAAWRENVLEQ